MYPACFQWNPVVLMNTPTEGKQRYSGLAIDILEELAEVLNFKYVSFCNIKINQQSRKTLGLGFIVFKDQIGIRTTS